MGLGGGGPGRSSGEAGRGRAGCPGVVKRGGAGRRVVRGAVGRVGGPGVLDRTASPCCFLLGAGPAPSVSEPQLLSLNPGPLSPPSEAVPGCSPPSRGGSRPPVTSVKASCAESAGENRAARGLGLRAGRTGWGRAVRAAALGRPCCLHGLPFPDGPFQGTFHPGGAMAGRWDFLPRPSRYPLGRGQKVVKGKQPNGRRGWALLAGGDGPRTRWPFCCERLPFGEVDRKVRPLFSLMAAEKPHPPS